MRRLIDDIWKQRDLPAAILLGGIGLAALWVLSLPVCGWVQDAYLHRFHLRSHSFAGWAAQQLTPAMYNLENTYWFSPRPISADQRQAIAKQHAERVPGVRPVDPAEIDSDADVGDVHTDMVNHFPTRTMTFAQARAYLSRHRTGSFYFRSRYRDRELETTVHISPLDEHRSAVIHGK